MENRNTWGLDALVSAAEGVQRIREESSRLSSEIEAARQFLTSEKGASATLSAELTQARQELARVSRMYDELQKGVHREREAQTGMQGRLQVLAADFEAKYKLSYDQLESLRTHARAIEKDLQQERAATLDLRTALEKTKLLLEVRDDKLTEMVRDREIAALKTAEETAELKHSLATLQEARLDLERRLTHAIDEVERWHAKNYEAELALEKANALVIHLETQIDDLNAGVQGELGRMKQQFQQESVALKEQLRVAREEAGVRAGEQVQLETKIRDLTAAFSQADAALKDTTARLQADAQHALAAQDAETRRDLTALQEQLRAARQEISILEAGLSFQRQQEFQAHEQVRARDKELQELKALLVNTEAMKSALWQELREAQSLLKQHKQENVRLNTIINMGRPGSNVLPFAVERAVSEISDACLAEQQERERLIHKQQHLLAANGRTSASASERSAGRSEEASNSFSVDAVIVPTPPGADTA